MPPAAMPPAAMPVASIGAAELPLILGPHDSIVLPTTRRSHPGEPRITPAEQIRENCGFFRIVAASPHGQAEAMTTTTTNPDVNESTRPHTLCRPLQDRMLAGVAAGFADYLEVDVTLVRIVLAVLAVMGGVGVPLYVAGWLLIPEEGATHSLASDLLGRSY
jgi:phage shock protein C